MSLLIYVSSHLWIPITKCLSDRSSTIMKLHFRKRLLQCILLLLPLQFLASNYYWIGGTGNWSDINHWATLSGGSSLQSVVPGPSDNVFFDAGSGFTLPGGKVTIDVVANCHDFIWNGAMNTPTLSGTFNSLNIYGSMTLQNGMSYIVTSTYFKSPSMGETVTTNGTMINGNVYYNGTGGWTLLDNYSATGYIYPMQGSLNTNSKTVSIYSFWTNLEINIPTSFSLSLGSSLINLSAFNTGGWYYAGTGTSLNAGTSHIIFTNASATSIRMIGQPGHVYYNVTSHGSLDNNGGIGYGLNFHKVSLKNNSIIKGNNTFDTLLLSAGKKYNFMAFSTQTITAVLTATASACVGLTELNSVTPGIQSSIHFLAGATCAISNAIIKDLNATGPGAPVTASGCVDQGNNTNILFTITTGNNLYWVGASGTWNDINHWSFTSGGVGGACIPTPADNVFFDANSGFTTTSRVVSLTGVGQYCHNINWNGALNTPTITGGPANPLNIYGSMTLQNGMAYIITSTYFKSSSMGETITTNGTMINGNVYYNGTGGWTLLDNYSSTGYIYPMQGSLNTNNKTVSINSFWTNGSITPPITFSLSLGSSLININTTNSGGWYYTGTGTSLNAGTSHIVFTNPTATNVRMAGQQGHAYYNVTAYGSLDTYEGIGFGSGFHRVNLYNNAIIKGSNSFDTLLLSAGKKYNFQASSTQTITAALTATAVPCTGLIEITSLIEGTQANIHFSAGATCTISNALIQDLKATGPMIPVTAMSSFDSGNNTNIAFTAAAGNNLYWIGGSGVWNNAAHWSFTSGGPGGACIPTPADNVFFDANSGFTTGNNVVSLTGVGQYCHNITWNGALSTPTISGGPSNPLTIYGSMTLQNGMAYIINNTYFKSAAMGKTITTNGTMISGNAYYNGTGAWTFQDNYNSAGHIYPMQGSLNTNGKTVNVYSFLVNTPINTPTSFSLTLGSSLININTVNSGGWYYSGTGASLNAGTSQIVFTNTTAINVIMSGQTGHAYYNVSAYGNLEIGFGSSFHRVYLYNNAILKGSNTFDTLLLSAGKTYTLQAALTQTVTQKLYTSGNPCFILFLKSSLPGTRANLNVMAGSVNYDFVDTKDINAAGLAFNAAGHSTNSGNNLNWTFAPTTTLGISGLGPDQVTACNAYPLILNTDHFYPNPSTSFTWYNASTSNTLAVADSGRYFISVNYGLGCVIKDTIQLSKPPTLPVTSSASNTVICNGSSVSLYASGVSSYTWSTGATSSSVSVSPSSLTVYSVTGIDLNECKSTNTISIVVNPTPTVSISTISSNSFCPGNNSVITPNGAATYTLMPGSLTGSSFTVIPLATTVYTINGTNAAGCISTPASEVTTTITVNPTPAIGIVSVSNSTICTGGNAIVTPNGATTYTLMPGVVTGTSFTVTPLSTTVYTISGTNAAGCMSPLASVADVTITVNPPQAVSINSISSSGICPGNHAVIALSGASSYSLMPGNLTGSSFTVSPLNTTNYTITGVLAPGCLASPANTITSIITVYASPTITLIYNDSITCFGGSTHVMANALGGIMPYVFQWQNNTSVTNVANYGSGNYTVIVNDANGCTSAMQPFTVIQPATGITAIDADKTPACLTENNGSITLNISGGTPLYTVAWSNGTTGNPLTNVGAGTLSAIITDANGCTAAYNTSIESKNCIDLLVPQIFTPNGDGKNDFFAINVLTEFPHNSFNVFNRWGSLVYSKKNYQNEWDGKPNVGDAAGNGLLPSGTYFIILDFGDDTLKPYKGYVEIKY